MAGSDAASAQEFGKYLLLERIAMGGMAEIFRAKKLGAEGFEKELVIKRVLPHFTDDESFITMFKDEARIVSNLNHANICQVFEFDELDGCFYIAMEYIPGRDLKKVNDVGREMGFPLTIGQVAWVGSKVAAGLHYAHRKEQNGAPLNIVHRDVTPHNVMVSIGGDVKLMDFGIAKAAARSTRTQAGTVKGKCAYMSPEQARGKDLDGRSDVFALGVVLWETLAQSRLFLGDTEFETLSNVLKKDAPSLVTVRPDVPQRLDEIIGKALARDRDERYEDAAAMERDLLAFFYSACDPNQVKLDAYMKHLFEGGPRPDLGEEVASDPASDALETVAMPAVAPNQVAADMAAKAVAAAANMSRPTQAAPDDDVDEPTTTTGAESAGSPPASDPPPPPPPPPPPAFAGGAVSTEPMLDRSGPVAETPETVKTPGVTPEQLAAASAESASQRMAAVDASPQPGLTAYTGQSSPTSGKRRIVMAGAAVVILGVGAIVATQLGGDSGTPASEDLGGEGGEVAPADGAARPAAGVGDHRIIRFESEPPGATVYLDGDIELFDKTPFEKKRRVGTVINVRAKLSGHKIKRNLQVKVEGGEGPQSVVLKLEPK